MHQEVEIDVSKDLPPLQNPDILIGVDDLTDLSHLHEAAGSGIRCCYLSHFSSS
jgi:hypothetical protein